VEPLANGVHGGLDPDRVVEESLELIGELSKKVRTISHLLHPPLLHDVGL